MNRKLVLRVTGRLLEAIAGLMVLPMVVSLLYREAVPFVSFLLTALLSLALGIALRFATRGHKQVLYAKEGFVIVALAWLSTSLIGCLPFYISGEIPSFVDAFFETVSGFTTTGATILGDVEALSHGMLFWRSFTHWIGGMGVLVFMVAFMSNIAERSMHILRAEMPGPIVGKLVPRARDTSKVLYGMYIILTLLEVILLTAGGMPVFDSIIHTFGTAGTGGFSLKTAGISAYAPHLQWIIAVFMFIFGVNFNLYYLMSIRRFKPVLRSTELRVYLCMAAAATILITLNLRGFYPTFEETLRHAFFQVGTIITTTGYATTDFNYWPTFSKAILFVLMFTGSCAGSTAGGLKISRVVLLWKLIVTEVRRMIHPRSVTAVKFEDKEVEESTLRSVAIYFAVYMICYFILVLILAMEPYDMETTVSAASACFNNIGPGFGVVGPMGSYAGFSVLSKIVLSFAMLMGRLEIFPILIAMIPSTWRRN